MKINILMCLVFILFVGAHIIEERRNKLSQFFNIDWFKTDDPDFPVTRFEALWKDLVGLFIILATMAYLAYLGKFGGVTILMAVGFIAADTIQHSVFSIVQKSYTPGIATCVLYLGYILYFFIFQLKLAAQSLGMGRSLMYICLGGALLLLNYLTLKVKIKIRCRKKEKEGTVKYECRKKMKRRTVPVSV